MKVRNLLLIFVLCFVFIPIKGLAQSGTLADVAESHIQGNVPEGKDFDAFLKRDLENYFKDTLNKSVTVKYEFLRNGPTQSGVAYPKYYIWVKIFDKKSLIGEGAVRVAAIEKKKFEITNYLDKKEIKNNAEMIYSVFPAPVCNKIKEKI